MGIPGLLNRLRPFSKVEKLGDRVIIDGPALAYHIYHVSEGNGVPSESPLDQISYKDLGEQAIAWLEDLESCGVVM